MIKFIFIDSSSALRTGKNGLKVFPNCSDRYQAITYAYRDYRDFVSKSDDHMKKYILAHNTGTGGNKAILCNLNGKVLYSNYQPYDISYPYPEWVEQDPDELWSVVTATTRKVIQEPGIDPDEILVAGVSA